MQTGDMALAVVNWKSQTRPIIYIAEESVARSETFRKMFIEQTSPWREAVTGLKGFILMKPFIAAYAWWKARRDSAPSGERKRRP